MLFSEVSPLLPHTYIETHKTYHSSSVTRFGDLLDYGQLFKAFGNNSFAQISHILRQFLERCQIFFGHVL